MLEVVRCRVVSLQSFVWERTESWSVFVTYRTRRGCFLHEECKFPVSSELLFFSFSLIQTDYGQFDKRLPRSVGSIRRPFPAESVLHRLRRRRTPYLLLLPSLLLKLTPSEDGVPCYNPNLPRDWNNSISEYENLLQQRTIDKFVPPDLSYYRNCLLLDDVGNCVPGTNESANCSNP
ncbi:hypothetical protein MLD38_000117 [Melastoma candidum]|uniref:Uncharacterized protein n=1 Tax=Melastoma candidum TaxID=119954 RepID=A0ACB9S8M5_9MYRT|nr:hypothetical protein MLD38_000117 [Melastoma candidum]